jgi:two-component system, sensor histidine kinase and response regulator
MTRILVIEDESFLREEIMEWMTFEGYKAIGAANGLIGTELALKHQPDLILCDVTMRGLDGYGVLQKLRGDPATADIPLIFMTARAAQEDIHQGIKSGADDYLTKPFYQEDLLCVIQARPPKK